MTRPLPVWYNLGNRSGSGSSGVNLATPEVIRAAPPTSRLIWKLYSPKNSSPLLRVCKVSQEQMYKPDPHWKYRCVGLATKAP